MSEPPTGSNRNLSDASLAWGEMILIVTLPQPPPQLCLDLQTNARVKEYQVFCYDNNTD